MKKFSLFLIVGFVFIFLIPFASSATKSSYYYFNSYSTGEAWANNPANMVDGVETNYASTVIQNDVQLLNANNCTGVNLGVINSVEIRAYGYYSSNDEVTLVPVFNGANDGDAHLSAVPATTGAWGSWFNIANDTNAPASWTWTDVQNLDVDVNYIKSGGGQLTYVGEVEINVTYIVNTIPALSNITLSNSTLKGGNTLTIYANSTANGVNDTDGDTLNLYCDTSTTPTSANTDCTGGTTSDATDPYDLTCTFAVPTNTSNHTIFCRLYDGTTYSNLTNGTYETDYTPPITSVISVAGDTAASYFDTVNDGITEINISGEANMACRWSSSDVVYSSMTNDCTTIGTNAQCNVTAVLSQGFYTRYVSCKDKYGNEQNTSQNLNVLFFLDYTAPTTSDNSDTSIHVPTYIVTINESDNVDSDPTTYYCTDTSVGCNPITLIDDRGTISYTSSHRGTNYLRYYSVDDAGNTQVIVNRTININQLPVFYSSVDNADIIASGTTVNVSGNFSELDVGQTVTMYVCNSSNVNSGGCINGHHCNFTSDSNASCIFTAESNSGTYNWYSFIYDELGEGAVANFSGTYTVDSTAPVITVNSPTNDSTITQSSVTFTITSDESLSWAAYSLNYGVNVSMSNTTVTEWTHTNLSIADGTYNLTFYANDSYNNSVIVVGYVFTIDTIPADTTPPVITIWSPTNGSYSTSADVLLNITSNEVLGWAGWQNFSESFNDLGNVSATSWNATVTFAEGLHNLTFYANDTSNNQESESTILYVDLQNPDVDAFSCSDVNDSLDVICAANISDEISLDYAIIGYNATGSWQNSSQISLSGLSDSLSYTIKAGNHSPLGFTAEIYLYDSSGRENLTESDDVVISDDIFPVIANVTHYPNLTDDMDPGVLIKVNASISEDFNISSVYLMYQNISDGIWISVNMSNNSAMEYGSSATAVYNGSFTPQNGTWIFRINATDLAGNQQLSDNTTIEVIDDLSFYNSTSIPTIKSFTTAQELGNNSLGYLFINNTGDSALNFTINITSSIRNRFNVNYTENANATYELDSGVSTNLTILVNTTSLDADTYNYNLSVSSDVGTTTYENQLNIQTAIAPYLTVTISTYPSSVTVGDKGTSFVATVENSGTQEATGVYLNWTLPSEFTLASGSQNKSIGTLSIGGSGTNTITINVSSSISASSLDVTATSSITDSFSNDTKSITISQLPTDDVGGTGGDGGGGGSSGIAIGKVSSVVFDKEIEIVRGADEVSFEIEVTNHYKNLTLEDLVLTIKGYDNKYLSIYPSKIDKIDYGETEYFIVTISAPVYRSYEEYELIAVIEGFLKNDVVTKTYEETQNIRLIIQESSREETIESLIEAEKAVQEMIDAGFNVDEVERLLKLARAKLEEDRNNKEALDLSKEIIKIKKQAFKVENLIRRVAEANINPKKNHLLIGNVMRDFDGNYSEVPLNNLLTGDSIFSSEPVKELISLAIVAFERGDYNLAEERINDARSALILERKGDPLIFLYLYWYFIIIAIFIFSFSGIFGYRKYQKSAITRKIEDMNNQEINIKNLMIINQKKYFKGQISGGDYQLMVKQNEGKLANLRKIRITLRNKRIKILKPEEISRDLKIEKMQINEEIKKLQTDYYINKKISEKEYKFQFEILNERLAEIEEERITINLLESRKKQGKLPNDLISEENVNKQFEKLKNNEKINKKDKIKLVYFKIIGILKSPFIKIKQKLVKNKEKQIEIKEKPKSKKIEHFKSNKVNKINKVSYIHNKSVYNRIYDKIGLGLSFFRYWIKKSRNKIQKRDKKGIMLIDNKFIELIKEELKEKPCKGKWIKINFKEK